MPLSAPCPTFSRIACLAPTVLFSLTANCWSGEIHTVDDDRVEAPTADYTTIQAAIDAAAPGDTINVYPGIYTGTRESTQVAKMNGLALTLQSVEGPEVTFIDGQSERRGIVCSENETNSTTIEGFTIRNGRAAGNSGPGGPYYKGGGMNISNASPTVRGCTFSGNYAAHGGGGMSVTDNAMPLVTDCLFEGNWVDDHMAGAGMTIVSSAPILTRVHFRNNGIDPQIGGTGLGVYGGNCSAELHECLFEGHGTTEDEEIYGGGAYFSRSSAEEDSTPLLNHCVFRTNKANYGGGLGLLGGSPVVIGCIIEGNEASYNGGGLWLNPDPFSSPANLLGSPLIQLTYIGDNTGILGGGAYCASQGSGDEAFLAFPTFERCVFKRNLARSGGLGGGMFIEGGNGVDNAGKPNIRGCSFIENRAIDEANESGSGGGLHIENSSSSTWATISHCLFMCNEAGNDGGGVTVLETVDGITIAQCLFHDNTAHTGSGGGLLFEPGAPPFASAICNSQFQYNTVLAPDGTCSGCEGSNNSPGPGCGGGLFVDSNAWCLQELEPMVLYTGNSFWSNSASAPCTADYRLPTTAVRCIDNPGCEIKRTCPSDDAVDQIWTVEEDNHVLADLSCSDDLNPLRMLFLQDGACPADLNGDNQVDGADLTILLGLWGQECPDPYPYPTTCGDPEGERARPFPETLHGAACCGNPMSLDPDWLASALGENESCLKADLNGDGIIGGADLSILLGTWGACPE